MHEDDPTATPAAQRYAGLWLRERFWHATRGSNPRPNPGANPRRKPQAPTPGANPRRKLPA